MKHHLRSIVFVFVVSLLAHRADAQATLTITAPLTHREQAAVLSGETKSEKINWMRNQVLGSRYGQRGLNNLFKNFDINGYIEPAIPGVTKNLNALNSLSRSQAKGAVRTLLYATKVYRDPRFDLVAVDQPVNASYGRTDKDLVLRHTQTGQRSRIEVKDVKPASQRADLERIKGQISKMSAEYRRTGELQAWANRQETIPAIKEFAQQNGIPVYERMKQAEFSKLLDDLERRSIVEARVKLAGGTLSTAGGIALLYTSTRGLLSNIQSDSHDLSTKFRIGEQSAMFVAGSGFTASGLAQIGSGFARTEGTLARLSSLTKWGNRAGIIGVVVGESVGIGIDYYNWDNMTARQKAVSKTQHVVGFGTFAAGFGIGLAAGIETGPGAIAIGLATGVASYAASKAATAIVDSSYDRLDKEQKHEVERFIYHHYGFNQ